MFDKHHQEMLKESALDNKAEKALAEDTPIIVGLMGGVAFIGMLLIIVLSKQEQVLSTTAVVSLILATVLIAVFSSWAIISLNRFFYFDYHRSQLR